jgi:adenylate cyclase
MMPGEDPASSLTAGRVRKLAALLSADVEGYSRLMGEDEAATVHTLTVYRAVIQTLVQQHRGRVVDSPGDNVLAEFASVVDAVQCAVAFQRELSSRNTALPIQRRMKFRVGINLGDVIVDGERIYGDGVNIAARLESLAPGGGICIAGSVYEQVKTKLALGYEDMGTQHVKNIAERVRVYRVRPEPGVAVPLGRLHKLRGRIHKLHGLTPWRRVTVVAVALLALLGGGVGVWQLVARPLFSSAKPSIAVLPFVNMSGDSAQEYLSDGMTEDLITELSRLDGLLIIARNSAFTYKGKEVKPEQVSRELGVRYMLEGRVRTANNRIRITAQLVDGTTGYHVWAQSYDRDLDDIFAVQGEIARMITRSLAVQLTAAEERQMGSPYTTDPEAWKDYQEGLKLYRRFTSTDNVQARARFESAIRRDPKFAKAYALLAATHRQDWILGWNQDLRASEQQAYDMAEKAVGLAELEPTPKPSLPHTLLQRGFVHLYAGRLQKATADAEKAIELSPNYADGYALAAHVLIYQGRPQDALDKMKPTATQDPNYPYFYDYYRGHAYYVLGFLTPEKDRRTEHFKEAEKYLRKALEGRDKGPNFRPANSYLVAVLSELGRQQEAVAQAAKVPRPAHLRDPQRLEEFIKRILPYDNKAITARLIKLWQDADSGAPPPPRTGTTP